VDFGALTQIGSFLGAIVGGIFAGWQAKRTRHDMHNGFRTALVEEIAARVEARVDERVDERFEAYDKVLAAHLTISHERA